MDTGESTEQTVKTIAQGMPLFSVVPVVTTLVCFFSLHARLRVQQNTRYSLRPLLFEGILNGSGVTAPRGCEVVPSSHGPSFACPLPPHANTVSTLPSPSNSITT